MNTALWIVAGAGCLAVLYGVLTLQQRDRDPLLSPDDWAWQRRTAKIALAVGVPAWVLPVLVDWLWK